MYGNNASGKSSILEAIQFLVSGRSWRCTDLRNLITNTEPLLRVRGQFETGAGEERLGVEFERNRTVRRVLNESPLRRLSDLAVAHPTLVWNHQLSELVTGPPENRRRWIDWIVFHVEHQRYPIRELQRILKQKAQALAQDADDATLEAINQVAAEIFHQIWVMRESTVLSLNASLKSEHIHIVSTVSPGIESISEQLREKRTVERKMKRAMYGPQSDSPKIIFQEMDAKHFASRGQQIRVSTQLLAEQIRHIFNKTGNKVMLLVDDLNRDLDAGHSLSALDAVEQAGSRIIATGTSCPEEKTTFGALFHVEQSAIHQVI